MLKRVLLGLSHSGRVRRWVTSFPPSRRVARRFVAGETLAETLEVVRALNQQGILATLDHLGENTRTPQEAGWAAEEYLKILDAIHRSCLDSNISLKPTQMGLDLGEDLCYENVRRIVKRAREHENFVRIDMESSQYTERTLRLYHRLRGAGFANVGVVIQAYLFRSWDDVAHLIEQGANVRLCKGAYAEPPQVAFRSKRDVDRNFLELLEMLWSSKALNRGVYVAVATHDEKIVRWARRFADERGIPRDRFEFQMLYGIRRELQRALAGAGHRVRVYVSYGEQWYPYFMRRLAERPANLLFLARQLVRK